MGIAGPPGSARPRICLRCELRRPAELAASPARLSAEIWGSGSRAGGASRRESATLCLFPFTSCSSCSR